MLRKQVLCSLMAACIAASPVSLMEIGAQASNAQNGNLYSNGDFETGESTPWDFGMSKLDVGQDISFDGQYAAYFHNKPSSTSTFRQRVTVDANKTYLASGMILADSETKALYECYPEAQGVSVNRPYRAREQRTFGKEDGWQRVSMTLETGEITGAGTLTAVPINWNQDIGFYADDLYLGELQISDIQIDGDATVPIPRDGATEAVYTVSKILNQLGTDTGLYNQTISSWRLKEQADGVRIAEDGTLTVQSGAMPGRITIQAVCIPSYLGAAQSEAVGDFEVELVAADKTQPVADEVQIAGKVAAGSVLTGSYRYTQEENEPEGDSVFRWLYSDSADGVYQPIPGAAGQGYTVEERYETSYIVFEVTPVTADGLRGNAVRSMPVKKVIKPTGKNLYQNPGFETGTTAPWSAGSWLTATNAQAGEGEYSAYVENKPSSTSFIRQRVAVEPNKTYLASGLILSTSDTPTAFECYPEVQDIKIDRPYRAQETVNVAKSDGWKRVSLTIQTGEAGGAAATMTAAPMYWNTNVPHYIDDLYLGELIVSGIEIFGENTIEIPESGTVTSNYRPGKVLNQLGTDTGLYKETVKGFRLKEDYDGVNITPEGLLTVSSEAIVGEIVIEAVCIPSYLGAVDEEATGELIVNLTSATNPPPYAKNVHAQGIVEVGETLHGSYQYVHRQNHPEGESVLRWLYSSQENGSYQPIPGATGAAYVVEPAYADSFIAFEVTAKTASGMTGEPVRSAPLVKAAAPAARDVRIDGSVYTGATLTGTYTYYDYNGDPEAASTFRWLRADRMEGPFAPIDGADAITYIPTEADTGKYLQFEVTPVSTVDPKIGAAAVSEVLAGPAVPEAIDVAITAVGGGVYRGSYTYRHPHGISEGTSLFRWFVDGHQAGSGLSFDASALGKAQLTFSVTPVAAQQPAVGQAVSVSKTVGQTTSISKSGGGGGRGTGSPIIPVQPAVDPKPADQLLNIPDMERHWALQSAQFVVQNDILSLETDGNFYPERLVTRAEFVTYIGRALQLKQKPYSGIFSDVDNEQWYAGYLQAAVDAGIISVDTVFRPNDTISRQEVAKVIVEGFGQWIAFTPSDRVYADDQEIALWAKGYVSKITGSEIVQGDDENRFLPVNPMTRAQAAAIMQRLFQKLEMAKGE